MTLVDINDTILKNQTVKLDDAGRAEALSWAAAARDPSLAARRLAAACALSDRWPMAICDEVARALLPGGDALAPQA
jgi:hypothetical protein